MGGAAGVEVRLDETRGRAWPSREGRALIGPSSSRSWSCLLLLDVALWGFLNHFCSCEQRLVLP